MDNKQRKAEYRYEIERNIKYLLINTHTNSHYLRQFI